MPNKLRQSDVIVTKRRDGSYECSVNVGRYLARMIYYGYTKREAVRLFVHAARKET